ncbi:MAG: DNA-processing protein DprA [SAR324 cluster bacterium]|nr:DNA-processing protein DprA [SAR324 cluster bacterium]
MVLESAEKDWLALSVVSGVGTQTLQKLSEIFGSLSKIWQKSSDQLLQLGLKKDVIGRLTKAMEVRSFQIEKRLIESSPNLRLFCPESEWFPANLLQIHSVPSVLYVKGELPDLHNLCLGIVGSRSCTSYGRDQTKRLVYELAELVPDAFVISGLARGIDTVAHEASLESRLRTIAVLAGGLQHIYPPENQNLAGRICQQGALISEFPLATKPVSHNFPIRNRVISGISQGILVTEASVKGGALIIETFGQEQNCEVFAVPGRIDSHPSSGCN